MAKRKTRRERRTYSDEYKQKVLELISVGDKSVAQICRDLDLTPSAVNKWIKADKSNSGIMTQNSLSETCLLYTSPSPRDQRGSRMPSSA